MVKLILSFLLILIPIFVLPQPSLADDPVAPEPCIEKTPRGNCTATRLCCQYVGEPERKCDKGYCIQVQPAPPPVPPPAGPVSISSIGDLNLKEAVSLTITGLKPNQIYAWEIRRFTDATHLWGTDPYSQFNKKCFTSDNNGQIKEPLGPFSTAGYYRLGIFKGDTGGNTCTLTGNKLANQDFSVGGPVNGSPDRDKGLSCCNNDRPLYDRDRDRCKQIKLFITEQSDPTNCSKTDPKSFCEPDSLRCFKTQTFAVQGKICLDPNDPNFDKKRNIVCAFSGGKQVEGCTHIKDPNDSSKLIPHPNPGIATAIGCIRTNPSELAKSLLQFGIGISGGLSFLMMLFGAFQMMTSAGNPETLNAGRQRLTSAIIGLLFVILSILILQIIGWNILQLPGFGTK